MTASNGTPAGSTARERTEGSAPKGATEERPDPEEASAEPADPEATPTDVAEKPGSDAVPHEHADALADEWGEESFPSSDPPAHY